MVATVAQLGGAISPTWRRLPSKLGATPAQLGQFPSPSRARSIIKLAELCISAMWHRLFKRCATNPEWAKVSSSLSKTNGKAVSQLPCEELACLLSEGCYVKTPPRSRPACGQGHIQPAPSNVSTKKRGIVACSIPGSSQARSLAFEAQPSGSRQEAERAAARGYRARE